MSHSTIKQFAATRRLRMVTDKQDGTPIINGRDGHIYEYDPERLAVMYLSDSVGKANNRRKACEAVSMEIVQNAETEFAAVFQPTNSKQATLAARIAGCKTKRVISPERRQQISETLRAYRESGTLTKSPSEPTVAGHQTT